jgi:hypothetical protein
MKKQPGGLTERSSQCKSSMSSYQNAKKKMNFKSNFIERLSNKENAISKSRKSFPVSANTTPKLKTVKSKFHQARLAEQCPESLSSLRKAVKSQQKPKQFQKCNIRKSNAL